MKMAMNILNTKHVLIIARPNYQINFKHKHLPPPPFNIFGKM